MSSPLRIRAASESGVDVVIEDTNGNEFATTGRLVSHVANKRAQLIIEAVNSHTQQQERIEEMEGLLKEFASDLEAEVKNRYGATHGEVHPALKFKYDRDMEPVVRARTVLDKGGK